MSGGRRSSAEVRRLLLEAAQELFAAKGYAATTTREIAERAGVSETLLFRHFSSKQRLFDRAILRPFQDFVAEFVEQWEAHDPGEQTPEELFRYFVGGFYDLLQENRELTLALAAASLFEGDANGMFGSRNSPLSELLKRVDDVAEAESAIRGYAYDPPVAVRLVVGMILSVTLLEDWLFPPRRRPSRTRAVNEIVAMMKDGITHRTVPPEAPG
ncbi:MAG: TetR/AcrR family transcriptional regulator [Acidimicrobiia bacterium]